MFDVPVDAIYVWLGITMVSLATFGVVVALPSAAPPDATAAARAVDAVAVGPAGSQATHALTADQLKLGPHRIGLDGPGGRSHAAFAYGPVTPTFTDNSLSKVLAGKRPAALFESPSAFAGAVAGAQDSDPDWRPAPDRLTIRRVTWGEVHVTLVG